MINVSQINLTQVEPCHWLTRKSIKISINFGLKLLCICINNNLCLSIFCFVSFEYNSLLLFIELLYCDTTKNLDSNFITFIFRVCFLILAAERNYETSIYSRAVTCNFVYLNWFLAGKLFSNILFYKMVEQIDPPQNKKHKLIFQKDAYC